MSCGVAGGGFFELEDEACVVMRGGEDDLEAVPLAVDGGGVGVGEVLKLDAMSVAEGSCDGKASVFGFTSSPTSTLMSGLMSDLISRSEDLAARLE